MANENKLIKKIDSYIKCYSQPPYGKAVEGTVELLKEVKEVLNKLPKENGWIPCSEIMPDEHDSIFAKFKNTEQWNNSMFEKCSNDVNVTVEFEDGTKMTKITHTIDGVWKVDKFIKQKVIAWKPLPQPYEEEK